MIILEGKVQPGSRHWSARIPKNLAAFQKATGENLYPGTVNVKVGSCVPIREHFRIFGSEIEESEDFLFEVCRINGLWAYRVRPLNSVGTGGAGDSVLEITCTQKIASVEDGAKVSVELFRNEPLEKSALPFQGMVVPVLHG